LPAHAYIGRETLPDLLSHPCLPSVLSKWGREEFTELTDEEAAKIEVSYSGAFPQ
jgi:hypothetical protein